nr:DNA translocase FtsK 4TM domain-containing protein [Perlucidibaca piscinae]
MSASRQPADENAGNKPGLREIRTLVWLLFAGFTLLALASHDPSDSAWTRVGNEPVRNAGGVLGAWMADVLGFLLGGLAWAVPALLIWRVMLLWRQPAGALTGLRQALAWLIAMFSLAALLQLHFVTPGHGLENAAGGVLGQTLGMAMWRYTGIMGSSLILITVFLLSVTLASGLSWSWLLQRIGSGLWLAATGLWSMARPAAGEVGNRLKNTVAEGWEQHQAARSAAAAERADKAVAAAAAPQSVPAAPSATPAVRIEPTLSSGSFAPVMPQAQAMPMAAPVAASVVPAPVSSGLPAAMPVDHDASDDDLPWDTDEPSAPRAPTVVVPSAAGIAAGAAAVTASGIAIAPLGSVQPASATPAAVTPRPTAKPVIQRISDGSTLPSLALLDAPEPRGKKGYTVETLEAMSRLLEIKLKEFNVDATVVAVQPGPVITRFEIQPAAGVKVARITNIAKDLARAMAMVSVRVVEVIPGKSVVGIEVPNQDREMVRLSEILSSQAFASRPSPLTLALGKDIAGNPIVSDLARMPHLLVAGTTGSGKSVGVNAMILSMLFKATPAELRLIMIDPKMLELSVYDKIPHLLTPVVTDMKDAANALRWCVAEMERRYKLMSKLGVRNLEGYNKKVAEAIAAGEPIKDPLWRPGEDIFQEEAADLGKLPFIVVIIDEFADMIMIVGKKVEELIARIAQKARAAGIHLILATQRPSVDVITGLIKANVPTRIAFQVSSRIDSRTILDQGGAEMLLGHGDMLFLPPGTSLTERVHGAFVSDDEVHRVCGDWRSRGEPDYIDEILEGSLEVTDSGGKSGGFGGFDDVGGDPEQDALYDEAVSFVLETRRPSISFVQRKFKIGYNRAARLIEAMENAGVVSPMQSNGQREVMVPSRNE